MRGVEMLINKRISPRRRAGMGTVLCLFLMAALFPVKLEAQSFPPLFIALGTDIANKLNDRAKAAIQQSTVRRRTVKAFTHLGLNSNAFQQLLGSHPMGAPLFQFNLPGTAHLMFAVVSLRQGQDGRLIWKVAATNVPGATGLLIVNPAEKSIIGDLQFGGMIFQIRPAGTEGHSIYTVDPSMFPPDHVLGRKRIKPISKTFNNNGTLESNPINPVTVNGAHILMADDSVVKLISYGGGPVPVLDVMVLYTSAAASVLVPNSILDEIEIAQEKLIESFTAEGIPADVRVVSKRCIGGFESGSLADEVPQLRMDPQVKNWRDNKDFADLVTLWVENAGPDCGATPDMGINNIPILPSREADAFSIIDVACAVGNYSFAHELGHQMGLFHDRVTAGAGIDFHWNYGFVSTNFDWKTIMAWDPPGCPLNEINKPYCLRLNLWSDGIIGSRGVPISVMLQTGAPTALGPANNVDALIKNIPVAANFRLGPTSSSPVIEACPGPGPPSAPQNLVVK
jgi:hypothetical protein